MFTNEDIPSRDQIPQTNCAQPTVANFYIIYNSITTRYEINNAPFSIFKMKPESYDQIDHTSQQNHFFPHENKVIFYNDENLPIFLIEGNPFSNALEGNFNTFMQNQFNLIQYNDYRYIILPILSMQYNRTIQNLTTDFPEYLLEKIIEIEPYLKHYSLKYLVQYLTHLRRAIIDNNYDLSILREVLDYEMFALIDIRFRQFTNQLIDHHSYETLKYTTNIHPNKTNLLMLPLYSHNPTFQNVQHLIDIVIPVFTNFTENALYHFDNYIRN